MNFIPLFFVLVNILQGNFTQENLMAKTQNIQHASQSKHKYIAILWHVELYDFESPWYIVANLCGEILIWALSNKCRNVSAVGEYKRDFNLMTACSMPVMENIFISLLSSWNNH